MKPGSAKNQELTPAEEFTLLVPLVFTLTKAKEGRKGFFCSQFEVIKSSVVGKAWC